MACIDDLWGGRLVDLAFDLRPWQLRCVIDVNDDGTVQRYELLINDESPST